MTAISANHLHTLPNPSSNHKPMEDVVPKTDLREKNVLQQSILTELAYMSITPDRLIIDKDIQIGSGGGGEVLLAKLRTNDQEMPVAVKCIWNIGTLGDRHRFTTRFIRELKAWVALRHLNVLPLLGFHINENHHIAQLISPYMMKGNAKQYISEYKPALPKRMNLVRGIIAGVEYLHTRRPPVCHGDLKPGNVLVSDDNEATICDFGLAGLVQEPGESSGLTTSHSIKGSTRYMSPELLLETGTKHDLASDVWAWGCTVFEILTDCPPYRDAAKDPHIILAMDRRQSPGDPESFWIKGYETSVLSCLRALIRKSWSFFPAMRPTMPDITQEATNAGFFLTDVKRTTHVWIKYRYAMMAWPIDDLRVCIALDGKCSELCCCDRFGSISVPVPVPVSAREKSACIPLDGNYRSIGIKVVYSPNNRWTRHVLDMVVIDARELAIPGYLPSWKSKRIQAPRGEVELRYRLGFSLDTDSTAIFSDSETSLANAEEHNAHPSLPVRDTHSPPFNTRADRRDDVESPGNKPAAADFFIKRLQDTEGTHRLSSGATFYTARSQLSSYQMSMPGGYR